MAVFLRIEKQNNKRGNINLVHYKPELLSEEDKKNGILLKEYNKPHKHGKITIPYWNYETSSVEFEFKDIPKTKEDMLNERINALEIVLANQLGK